MTVSAVSIIWFKYESEYKEDDTPNTALNSDAEIILGKCHLLTPINGCLRSGATSGTQLNYATNKERNAVG